MKVLNFGSLNLDYVYAVDHMVTAGETLASRGMQTFCGGTGLNQSIALARAGVPVYHAGLIGEEGESLFETCRESGVNTAFIRRIPGKSGHTIIQVDRGGQNCILLYGGANRSMTREYVDGVLENFGKGDMVLLQNEINLLDYIINRAYERGMEIVLNPSPYDHHLDSCDFSRVSWFLLNEIEGWQVTGEKEPDHILAKLRELYPKARVVLTLRYIYRIFYSIHSGRHVGSGRAEAGRQGVRHRRIPGRGHIIHTDAGGSQAIRSYGSDGSPGLHRR